MTGSALPRERCQPGRALIAGAGLAGSLCAQVLARQGWQVQVVERRSDPRLTDQTEGRSVNLGLSARGLAALEHAGLHDQVVAHTVPMRGRLIHTGPGSTSYRPYGRSDEEILRSIDRQVLLRILLSAAEDTGAVRFRFSTTVTAVSDGALAVQDCDGGRHSLTADLIVAADGAYSAVRQALDEAGRCRSQVTVAPWHYKELTIPPSSDGAARTRLDALHVWPAADGLIVAHPNLDQSLTATVFLPASGTAHSVENLQTASDVRTWLDDTFPDVESLMPHRVEEFQERPSGQLVTVRTKPWVHDGRLVLIGDAAHAVYPFYGQGMNAAFEDVLVLSRLLADPHVDLSCVLAEFERQRRRHLDVLAVLSEENFHELQRTATLRSRMRSLIDRLLSTALPKLWIPLYTMISHRRTPYADALRRAHQQDRVLLALVTAALVAPLVRIRSRRMSPGELR